MLTKCGSVTSVVAGKFHDYIIACARGSANQVGMAIGLLKEMPLKVPSLLVQRRIAGILSAYDALIENNLRRIRILEEMARSLYHEWFVHFRFPGHESVQRVDSTLGQIPEGWEVRRLGEILELNYGKGLEQSKRQEGVVPVFGSSGIVGHHDMHLVKGPGIIVGRKGNVGSVFWSDEDFFPIDTVFFVTSTLPLRFLFYELRNKNFINNDAAVPGLSRHQAYSLEVAIPNAELLTRFCSLANAFEDHASLLRQQVANLRKTRDLLLPRLLSGTIDVSESGSFNHDKGITVGTITAMRKSSIATTISNRELPRSSHTASAVLVDTRASSRDSIKTHSGKKSDFDYERPPPIDQTDRSDVLIIIRQVFGDGQPRTRESAIRDVARALDYGRVGHRIQDVLHTNLVTAVRRGILENAGGELRLLFRSIADYDREFLKQQFLGAIGRSWIERDDAIQNFCRWLGFRRTGPVIEETTRSLINGLLRESRLEADGQNLIRRIPS